MVAELTHATPITTESPFVSEHCSSIEHYQALHKQSLEAPASFWATIAEELVQWRKKPEQIVDEDLIRDFSRLEDVEWFKGGKLNINDNCLDRWAKETPSKIALIEEGDDHEALRLTTYAELKERVCRFANVLKAHGVTKGSNVGICLPSIWQAPVAMLAVTRLGAIHTVVFAGFSAGSLVERLRSSKCSHIITCDVGMRAGKQIDLFSVIVDAVNELNNPTFKTILFTRRDALPEKMPKIGSVVHADAEMAVADVDCPAEEMDADDPMFILHTSGSTGAPKGLTHRTGRYLNYVAMTMRYTFDLKPSDVYACVADVGWITGHSYVVYGPLLMGSSTVLFESLPTYPDQYRYWHMINKHKVTKFYTTPTATRILAASSDKSLVPDMPSLELIGSVGEPLTEDAWNWLFTVVGKNRCPIVDTYWQTETGGHVVVSPPGTNSFYPGAAGLPMFGIDARIVDFETGKPITAVGEQGALCIGRPWPGLFRQANGASLEKWFGQFKGLYFTGDAAMYVAPGYIRICGRVDDAINVSGHLFSSREFEMAMMDSGLVADSAAVGIDHDVKGQAVIAFVVLKDKNADQNEIIKKLRAHVRAVIGPIAVIEAFYCIRELPKTRSGKVVRRLLRQAASKQYAALREAETSTLTDPTLVEHFIEVVSSA